MVGLVWVFRLGFIWCGWVGLGIQVGFHRVWLGWFGYLGWVA